MIELKHVSGGYNGEIRLPDISLTIPDQTITTIIGPNGCGKSTLLRLISGLQKPYGGTIQINGASLDFYNAKALAKTISFLPQNRTTPNIRAESLVLHGRFPYMGYPRRYRQEDRNAAGKAMEWAGVTHLRNRNVATLSGGERQKVYIAMLLAQGTPIVLMDEPTSYLDIAYKFEVIRLTKQMKQAGKTVVMVLHDLDLALEHSDQVVLMNKGQVCCEGTPEQVYASGGLEEVFRIRAAKILAETGSQYCFQPLKEM